MKPSTPGALARVTEAADTTDTADAAARVTHGVTP